MKPLILILFAALSLQAQTLADLARAERARKAQETSRVYTNDDARRAVGPSVSTIGNATPPPVAPSGTPAPAGEAPAAPGQPAATPTPPTTPAVPVVDPVQQWNQQMQTHRNRIRDLQDQETAIQLQVNQFTSQFFAPVTDEASRNQAQARRAEAQTRLDAVRRELGDVRALVQQMEAAGPPRAQ